MVNLATRNNKRAKADLWCCKERRMTLMDQDTREKVITHLRGVSAFGRKTAITEQTEIYYDLQLYGNDLIQLALWLERKFSVPANVNLQEHGPPEGFALPLFRKWRVRRERECRRYKSLTIADVLAVIDAGQWPITEKISTQVGKSG
jgi:hypothetical protein